MTDAKREQARARQARRREALRAANLVRVELWLPPADAEAVRAFAADLADAKPPLDE